MSSTTPWGNPGAEPTTRTVLAVTYGRTARAVRRPSRPTGTRTSLILKYSEALMKAACADTPMIISGARMPRSCRIQSRVAFTAERMLSVPPLVIAPQTVGHAPGPASSGPPMREALMAATSASMRCTEGKVSPCSGLEKV